MPAHAASATPETQPVRQRGARRTQGHLERLPEHHRRLPRARHEHRQCPDASRHQHTDLHARTKGPDRTHDAGQNTQTPSRGHPGLLRYLHTTGGHTKGTSSRLEHLRGSALGFRNLTHYITRCLLETGGFRPQLHPQLSRAPCVLLVARPLNPSWTDSRGNLYICGNCEGWAIDNGLLADMLDSSCMRNIKAGAAGGIVEVIPDNPLIVVGQQPWVLRSL